MVSPPLFLNKELSGTADFIEKVTGVYNPSMETIYLSLVHTCSYVHIFHEIPGIRPTTYINILDVCFTKLFCLLIFELL